MGLCVRRSQIMLAILSHDLFVAQAFLFGPMVGAKNSLALLKAWRRELIVSRQSRINTDPRPYMDHSFGMLIYP